MLNPFENYHSSRTPTSGASPSNTQLHNFKVLKTFFPLQHHGPTLLVGDSQFPKEQTHLSRGAREKRDAVYPARPK